MARKSKSQGAPAPLPPVGEILKGRFPGAVIGPYDRWTDGTHLGPYSPRHVPIRSLKFMREHPQLSLGLAAYRGPFFGIDYDIDGGTPETRAFVRSAFLDTPLMYRVLETILNALDYGFQAHELIYDFRDVTYDPDGKGAKPAVTVPLAAVIVEANDIDPERVVPLVDDRDHLIGYRIDGWILDTIPIEKALHAVHAMEHRNWRGRSLLRRAYKPWWWSEFVSLFMTRWYERKSDPPYHGWAPSTPRPDPKDPSKNVYPTQVLRDQLLDVRASGAIVTPNEINQITKLPEWGIRELTDGGRAGEFVTGLAYLDALMLRALTVPEEITTRGSVGSQAKTETVLGVFLQALETVKKTLVLRTINQGIVRPLIEWNFGRSASVPFITAPEFNREMKELLGQLLVALSQVPQELDEESEFRPTDMLDWNRILSLLNAPHRKAAEAARPKGSFAPPMPEKAPPPPIDPAAAEPSTASTEAPKRESIDVASIVREEVQEAVDSFRQETRHSLSNMTTLLAASQRPAPAMGEEAVRRLVRDSVAKSWAKINERVDELAAADSAPAPVAAPPVVNNYITVPPSRVEVPIEHTSHVNISEGAVKVENNQGDVNVPERSVEVKGGDVHVTTPPSSAGKTIVFQTDDEGRVTGADVSQKPD